MNVGLVDEVKTICQLGPPVTLMLLSPAETIVSMVTDFSCVTAAPDAALLAEMAISICLPIWDGAASV